MQCRALMLSTSVPSRKQPDCFCKKQEERVHRTQGHGLLASGTFLSRQHDRVRKQILSRPGRNARLAVLVKGQAGTRVPLVPRAACFEPQQARSHVDCRPENTRRPFCRTVGQFQAPLPSLGALLIATLLCSRRFAALQQLAAASDDRSGCTFGKRGRNAASADLLRSGGRRCWLATAAQTQAARAKYDLEQQCTTLDTVILLPAASACLELLACCQALYTACVKPCKRRCRARPGLHDSVLTLCTQTAHRVSISVNCPALRALEADDGISLHQLRAMCPSSGQDTYCVFQAEAILQHRLQGRLQLMALRSSTKRPGCTVTKALTETVHSAIFAGDCFCIAQYAPVCGTDGKTYPNDCQLGCVGDANLKVAYQGECGSTTAPSPGLSALPSGQFISLMRCKVAWPTPVQL